MLRYPSAHSPSTVERGCGKPLGRSFMERKIWIDGSLVPASQAKISVYDHGVLYGDGVFEGIRQYNGRVFEKEAHLQRLFDSAQAIRLTIPYSREQLATAIEET